VKVLNDYGDVPRWYWQSTAFLGLTWSRARRRHYWEGKRALALAGTVAAMGVSLLR
jgi:hypothetical protein